MIRSTRRVAILLGSIILAWQLGNAFRGAFHHRFLAADMVVALLLIVAGVWPGDRVSAVLMLTAFATTGGVFLAATTEALLANRYDLGRAATTVGLIPCVVGSITLGRWLIAAGS